jgi:hypothetical protein
MLKRMKYTARSSSSPSYHDIISKLIEDCRNEPNKDKRIEILNQINSMLLKSDQVDIPYKFTNEYVNLALHKVEGALLLLAGSK